MQRELEDCCNSKGCSNRWTYLEDTGVSVILRERLQSHVEDCAWTRFAPWAEPCHLTKNRSPCSDCSVRAGSPIMNEGSLQSPLVYDVFCSSPILITICSSFVFMFVRGGRWIFSTAAVRDVKTMNSIKSLYLYFLLWDETKWKALEIICGCWGQKVFDILFWGGESITKQA